MESKAVLNSWLNICLKYGHGIIFFPMQCCAYNSYSTPNLDGCIPFGLVFGNKIVLESKPDVVTSGTFKTYCEKLKKNLNYLCSRLQMFRSGSNDLMNSSKTYHTFPVGQLVYIYQAKRTIVHTGSRISVCYFGGTFSYIQSYWS